jgi:hypothetical protein
MAVYVCVLVAKKKKGEPNRSERCGVFSQLHPFGKKSKRLKAGGVNVRVLDLSSVIGVNFEKSSASQRLFHNFQQFS